MALPDLDFYRGIAMVLQGESLKAGSAVINHNLSLGVLREKMVSRFIKDETPERFRVETGFVRDIHQNRVSKQCDLLIHNASQYAPLYRWEDFVVTRSESVKALIEVKSNLNKDAFDQVLELNKSVFGMTSEGERPIPVLGYGLDGVSCSSFIEYIQSTLVSNPLEIKEKERLWLNWPVCVAVQSKSYIGFRPLDQDSSCFFVLDLSKHTRQDSQSSKGIETGIFLQFYHQVLEYRYALLQETTLRGWINSLPLSDDGINTIFVDGEVREGRIGV